MPSFINSAPIYFLKNLLFSIFVVGFAVWGGLALWFQLPFGSAVRAAIIVFWGLFALKSIIGQNRKHRRLIFIVAVLGFIGWWSTIHPSLDRMWAPDVARTVTGTVDGPMVTLHNIRDFHWRTLDDYDANWKDETYNLDTIQSVDLFQSYWSSPAIAHTLLSFGFADGRHIVFSAEIRKEHHEEFSSLGGFFREFELAMIASEESDIIYTRTNMRSEDVYRYPLNIDPKTAKQLFLNYVDTGNRLAKTPQFYNTLSANCLTVVFDLARLINPGIPFDYRILLSGYLPGYLYDHHAISTQLPLAQTIEQAYINKRAEGGPEAYSNRIR